MPNRFENFPAESEDEPLAEVSAAEPAESGRSPEASREIIEDAKERRGTFTLDVFTNRAKELAQSPTIEVLLKVIPGIGEAAIATEVVRGKTLLAGRKLSARERVSLSIIAGGALLAYGLHFLGKDQEAITARGAAATMAGIEFGPEMLRSAAAVAEAHHPHIAHLLAATAGFVTSRQELAADFANALKDRLAGVHLKST